MRLTVSRFPASFLFLQGLDPTWEETFEFPVGDEATTKCFVKFMMGAEGEEKQIGDECKLQTWCKQLLLTAFLPS
jgi:hypothetical protein